MRSFDSVAHNALRTFAGHQATSCDSGAEDPGPACSYGHEIQTLYSVLFSR